MTITCQLWRQCKKQGWGMPAASQASHSECSRQLQHISMHSWRTMARTTMTSYDSKYSVAVSSVVVMGSCSWSLQLLLLQQLIAAVDCSCRILDCDCCGCWVWLGCCGHWLWLWWSLIVAVAVVDCGCLGCWLLIFCGQWLLLSWSLTAAIMDVAVMVVDCKIVIRLVSCGNREKQSHGNNQLGVSTISAQSHCQYSKTMTARLQSTSLPVVVQSGISKKIFTKKWQSTGWFLLPRGVGFGNSCRVTASE